MKTHIDAQEETVSALWDFARAVLEMTPEQRGSFSERPVQHVIDTGAGHDPITIGVSTISVTNEQLAAIRAPLERIVRAFGFAVAEIQ